MSRRRRDPASYEIGYGKPPIATRFSPGRSGNARGRPKGSLSLQDTFNEVMQERVEVIEGGKKRRITRIEIVLTRLASGAMRGDRRCIMDIVLLSERMGLGPAEKDLSRKMSDERFLELARRVKDEI